MPLRATPIDGLVVPVGLLRTWTAGFVEPTGMRSLRLVDDVRR